MTDPTRRRTFDHPDMYSFVDTSQNNLRDGQTRWDNMRAARRMVAEPPRPANSAKICGGSALRGGVTEGTHKFWRNIIGGLASSRFPRPGPRYGIFSIGLSEPAQTQIRSARMFARAFDLFRAGPDADAGLLMDRAENEAYLSFIPGEMYAVYFTDGGRVTLNLSDAPGRFALRWLDIDNSRWTDEVSLSGGRPVELAAPSGGQWVALLSSGRQPRGTREVSLFRGNFGSRGSPTEGLRGGWAPVVGFRAISCFHLVHGVHSERKFQFTGEKAEGSTKGERVTEQPGRPSAGSASLAESPVADDREWVLNPRSQQSGCLLPRAPGRIVVI